MHGSPTSLFRNLLTVSISATVQPRSSFNSVSRLCTSAVHANCLYCAQEVAKVNSSQVLDQINRFKPELEAMGVASLSLFGSVARGDERADSDVDFLVEFSGPAGLFKLLSVQQRLEDLLGVPVDLVTPGGLKPRMRDRILAEAIRAA